MRICRSVYPLCTLQSPVAFCIFMLAPTEHRYTVRGQRKHILVVVSPADEGRRTRGLLWLGAAPRWHTDCWADSARANAPYDPAGKHHLIVRPQQHLEISPVRTLDSSNAFEHYNINLPHISGTIYTRQ